MPGLSYSTAKLVRLPIAATRSAGEVAMTGGAVVATVTTKSLRISGWASVAPTTTYRPFPYATSRIKFVWGGAPAAIDPHDAPSTVASSDPSAKNRPPAAPIVPPLKITPFTGVLVNVVPFVVVTVQAPLGTVVTEYATIRSVPAVR